MTPITPGNGPAESPVDGPGDTFDREWHPAPETLSEFCESLLRPETAERVRVHLEGCPDCADTRDALQDIRTLLGSVEAPAMSADVVDRIDAALAAEAVRSATRSTGPGEDGQGDEEDLLVMLRSAGHELAVSDVARLLAAADEADEADGTPAFEAAADGDAEGSDTPAPVSAPALDTAAAGGRTGAAKAPAGAADARTSGPGRGKRRRRHAGVVFSTVALAGVAVLGGFLLRGLYQESSGSSASALADGSSVARATQSPPAAAAASGFGVTHPHSGAKTANTREGRVYTEQNLGSQIQELVADSIPMHSASPSSTGTPAVKATPETSDTANAPKDTASTALPSCVLKATGHDNDDPVATDRGTYDGGPVGVVVYLDGQSGDQLEVFLIDSSCEATAPSTPGKVKLHERVPKP